MNRKFAVAVVVTFAALGVVMAEEFTARITKVSSDGKTITAQRGKVKFDKDAKKVTFEKEGDPKEYTVVTDVKVTKKGGFGGKKKVEPMAVEKGLMNEMFSKIEGDGLTATITTDDGGKVTAITIGGGGKGGKKKKDTN